MCQRTREGVGQAMQRGQTKKGGRRQGEEKGVCVRVRVSSAVLRLSLHWPRCAGGLAGWLWASLAHSLAASRNLCAESEITRAGLGELSSSTHTQPSALSNHSRPSRFRFRLPCSRIPRHSSSTTLVLSASPVCRANHALPRACRPEARA